MMTDLTENDFFQEPKLDEKVKGHNFECNVIHKVELNMARPHPIEKTNPPKSLKASKLGKILFLGYIVKKFIRNLKEALKLQKFDFHKSLKNQKFLLINDLSFFQEGMASSKKKNLSFSKLKMWKMLKVFRRSYFIRLISKIFGKIPIIESFSLISNIWETLQFILILILTIYIPINVFFYDFYEKNVILFDDSLILTCRIGFIMDIIVKLNTSFFKNGVSITDRKLIIIRYLKYHLIKELLGFLSIFFCRFSLFFLIFFIFKIIKLKRIFSNFEMNYLSKNSSRIYFNFLINFIAIAVLSHYMACIWYYIGINASNISNSWLNYQDLYKKSLEIRYFYSFYYTFNIITLQTNGIIKPINDTEVICSFLFKNLAIFIFFYIIIKMGFLIIQEFQKKQQSKETFLDLNKYLKKNKINYETQIKLRNYLKNNLKNKKYEINTIKQKSIIDNMPENFRSQLLEGFISPLISRIPAISSNFSKESIKNLYNSFQKIKFYKNQVIFNENDMDDKSLYLILKGHSLISLPHRHNTIQARNKYDIIGALSFFSDIPRPYTFKALTKVSLLKLSQKDFLDVIKENPEDYEKFCEIRDKIKLEQNLEDLKISCKCCKFSNHDESCCPLNHYIPNRRKIIQKYTYSEAHRKRNKFVRNNKKHKMKKFLYSTIDAFKKGDQQSNNSHGNFEYTEEDDVGSSLTAVGSGKEKSSLNFKKSFDIDAIKMDVYQNYFNHNNFDKVLYDYNSRIKKKLTRQFWQSNKLSINSQKILTSFNMSSKYALE